MIPINFPRISNQKDMEYRRAVALDRQSQLDFLLSTYSFREVNLIRSLTMDCPLNGANCKESDSDEGCVCEDGVYEARAPWTNATKIWAAQSSCEVFSPATLQAVYTGPSRLLKANILLTEYSHLSAIFHSFFTVELFFGDVKLDKQLQISYGSKQTACSYAYDGGYAGSGIYNPEGLRGFCYRTVVYRPDIGNGEFGDGLIFPKNIIFYLFPLETGNWPEYGTTPWDEE